MAWFTGLAERGPAAGVTVVFPDGWQEAWHPVRPPDAEPELDDARFLLELTTHLEGLGAASSWPVFLTGPIPGRAVRRARRPARPAPGDRPVPGRRDGARVQSPPLAGSRSSGSGMTLVMGTGDPEHPVPGAAHCPGGASPGCRSCGAAWPGTANCPARPWSPEWRRPAPDWAVSNGITGHPAIADLHAAGRPRADPVDLVQAGCRPVTLYRIEGGGHGWPGGPQFLPARSRHSAGRDGPPAGHGRPGDRLGRAPAQLAPGGPPGHPAPPLGGRREAGGAGSGVVADEGEHDRVGVKGGRRAVRRWAPTH